jgi:hypothetical protein
MNDNNSFSVATILRALGALLLDAVVVIIFVKKFFWFTVMMPAGETLLMMFVLLLGLAAVDVVIIAPPMRKKVGVAYTSAISFLLVLYAIVANLVSILTRFPLLLVPSKIIWYVVWQLLILGAFILVIAVIAAFAKRQAQDNAAGSVERAARGNVTLLLSDMQTTLSARAGDPAIAPVLESFRALRERINASTPFGRIQSNPAAADLEYRIMGNLNFLLGELRINLSGDTIPKIQGLMEETRRMVMNRETLHIQ